MTPPSRNRHPGAAHLAGTAAMLLALSFVTPSGARAGTQRVTIRTDDGVSLAATWYEPDTRSPAVILVHMLHKTRRDWDAVGSRMASEGIGALALDLRGHGESTGALPEGDAPDYSVPIRTSWQPAATWRHGGRATVPRRHRRRVHRRKTAVPAISADASVAMSRCSRPRQTTRAWNRRGHEKLARAPRS
jgi:hypothetical protein